MFQFWINVPIGILAWIFGIRALPKDEPQGKLSDVDIAGSSQMSSFLVLLFLALNFGSTLGWTSPYILGALVLAILLFIGFILTEKRVQKPLLDLGIFKSKLFSMSLIMALLNFTVAMFSSILLPFYLQDYRGYAPGIAGLFMMCYPIAMLIFSPIAGSIADKINKEIVTFVGITGIVLSQLLYLFIAPSTPAWFIAGILFIQGMSMGIFQSPNNALIMETVDRKYLGIAGSVNSLARNVAFVLGTSLATLILFNAMSSIMGHKITSYISSRPEVFLQGMHTAFLFSLIFTAITWMLSIYRLIQGRKIHS